MAIFPIDETFVVGGRLAPRRRRGQTGDARAYIALACLLGLQKIGDLEQDQLVVVLLAGRAARPARPGVCGASREPGGTPVVQPLNSFGTGLLSIIRWHPGIPLADVTPLGLPVAQGLPSAAFTPDGVLYAASETTNSCGGRAEQLVRGTLSGGFIALPQIAGTTMGTSTFSAVAAGGPGDVGVLFYSTETCGNPSTLADATWSVK